MTKRRAFTLIELLTVIAISALLMTIIVVPVFQSFNFTRSAQSFADAQARARIVADRVSREIGNSVGVRSTSLLVQTVLNGNITSVPQHSTLKTGLLIRIQSTGLWTLHLRRPGAKLSCRLVLDPLSSDTSLA